MTTPKIIPETSQKTTKKGYEHAMRNLQKKTKRSKTKVSMIMDKRRKQVMQQQTEKDEPVMKR